MPQLDMYLWFFNLVIFVSFFLIAYYLFLYFVLLRLAKLFFFRKLYIMELVSLRFTLDFKLSSIVASNYYLFNYVKFMQVLVNFGRRSINFVELDKTYWLSLLFLKNVYLDDQDFFIDFELIDAYFFFGEKKFFFQNLLVTLDK